MNDLNVLENSDDQPIVIESADGVVSVHKHLALELFLQDGGLDPVLDHISSKAKSLVPDLSTKKSRSEIASIAMKVRKSKSAIDKIGKELVDDLKEKPKLIDAERKRCREALDKLAEEIRKPLTDFENAEKERIENHRNFINSITSCRDIYEHHTSEEIQGNLNWLGSLTIDELLEEFEIEAHRELKTSIDTVSKALERRKKYEADQAELERLRKEAEEKERAEREAKLVREAEEKAAREAEQKAEQARLKAEKAQREADQRVAKAEQDRIDAEKRAEQARFEAEQKLIRQQEEAAKEEARQKAAREADIENRKKINNLILSELITAGITEKQRKIIIEMIVRGKVPNTVINY